MEFNKVFLEITSSESIPQDVVAAWNKSLDYDYKMKRKFSYYDVIFKTKNLGRGFKGHLTKTQNQLKKSMDNHKLDHNETIKKLYHLYPPKYF